MAAIGVIGGNWMQLRGREERNYQKRVFKICCYSSPLTDSYNTLRVQSGASQSEVKKAFRQLALQVSLPSILHSHLLLVIKNENSLSFPFPSTHFLSLRNQKLKCNRGFIVFQYHPDVCRGSKCGVQFHQINQAYEVCYYPL